MTKRGAKSRTTIAGHTLTWAELTVLRQIELRIADCSSLHLREIFPGSENAKRHCARHLAKVGVLEACQIEFLDDVVKGKTP